MVWINIEGTFYPMGRRAKPLANVVDYIKLNLCRYWDDEYRIRRLIINNDSRISNLTLNTVTEDSIKCTIILFNNNNNGRTHLTILTRILSKDYSIQSYHLTYTSILHVPSDRVAGQATTGHRAKRTLNFYCRTFENLQEIKQKEFSTKTSY